MKSWIWCLVAASLLAFAPPATAQQTHAGPPAVAWDQLSAEQQQVLGRFREEWNALPPGRQQALSRGAERWQKMSPEQREMARQRFDRWQSLPTEDRQRIRERYERFRQLPPEQQQRLRENFRRFHEMPPERGVAIEWDPSVAPHLAMRGPDGTQGRGWERYLDDVLGPRVADAIEAAEAAGMPAGVRVTVRDGSLVVDGQRKAMPAPAADRGIAEGRT